MCQHSTYTCQSGEDSLSDFPRFFKMLELSNQTRKKKNLETVALFHSFL